MSRKAPKSIKMDASRLGTAMMVYLRDCSYVSSMSGKGRATFIIHATDGSDWTVTLKRRTK